MNINVDELIDFQGAKTEVSLVDRKKKIGKMISNLINSNDSLNKQISKNNSMLKDLLSSLKKYDCCL
ncbi:unknown similar to AMEV017 [Mythimna separata entomopoxvirus 'L']|uniref:Uncharacterized protein n=1 Tax=Mythimna separata entomopoxvirus 'L' TaxID=1293572 RepID=A0A916KQ51_9POXV|nr:unknown similar to AMEV017 [Mythimna separata entomopoxvirus 'L']CCU56238.1 unknown similar to AMEV017 [Mythimna separata entomopoxvirus 'L']